MRLFEIILTAALVVSLCAAEGNALTTVTHTNDTGGAFLNVGDTFNVDVTVDYDGVGPAWRSAFPCSC